jgi:hypothetical protein
LNLLYLLFLCCLSLGLFRIITDAVLAWAMVGVFTASVTGNVVSKFSRKNNEVLMDIPHTD